MNYQFKNGFLYHSYFILINHLLFGLGLYFYGIGIYQVSVFLLSYFVSVLGEEIGLHRYYTHRSFETTKFKENIILILSMLSAIGPVIWFVGTHRLHHKYSDTGRDPHSPYHISPLSVWICKWKKYKIPYSLIKDLCKDKKQIYAIRYYHLFWACIWIFGLLLAPCFTCFFCGGISMTYNVIMAVNTIGHMSENGKTYQVAGCDNKILAFLTAGAANHNTHHRYPSKYDQNINGKFDLVGIIIKKFFIK
jgi:stearoyl-CoA desaturase (delta-9 desaturase)